MIKAVISDKGDHPRVCGEHLFDGALVVPQAGSSPRVRGALDGVDGGDERVGIIPACAGSTIVR